MKIQKFKELSLLITGVLMSIIFMSYKEYIDPFLFYVIILAVILFLFGVGVLEFFHGTWFWLNRRLNVLLKKVYIYAPYEIDIETSSWIKNISFQQIERVLKEAKIRYSKSKFENNIHKFPVVVNPYGGVYPEKDVIDFQSLNNIFNYVRRGGVYVNIADIPFYYAFDPHLERKINITPLINGYSQSRSFLQSVVAERLHILVFNSESMSNGTRRIISLDINSKNLFNKEMFVGNDSQKKFSPFLAISYGRGYFVFSTFEISDQNLSSLVNIIKEAQKL